MLGIKWREKCQKLQEGHTAPTTSCCTLQYCLLITRDISSSWPAASCVTPSSHNMELQMNKEVTLTGLCKVTRRLHHHNRIPQKGPNQKEARSWRKMSYFHCYMCLTNTHNILLLAIFKMRNLNLALMYTFQEVIWKAQTANEIVIDSVN